MLDIYGTLEINKVLEEIASYSHSEIAKERILSLKEDEKKEIIEQAYKICDVYSIERFYDNIMEVYNRALKKYW